MGRKMIAQLSRPDRIEQRLESESPMGTLAKEGRKEGRKGVEAGSSRNTIPDAEREWLVSSAVRQ
jgi:hypothetical protein